VNAGAGKPVAIVSCDEKLGIQAIATTALDLLPAPDVHASFARDHEHKRRDTLSPRTYQEKHEFCSPPDQPALRIHFTPRGGSWLNLIEGFFSKFARSVLHHIRVTSKYALKERIMAGNRHPVIHIWSYKLAKVA
jgi:hypothetical protein